MFRKLIKFFSSGEIRSIKTKKNIIISGISRAVSIAIGIVLVPLTLNYVNKIDYGIWLTLSSLLSWINVFDIGLGGGLRNNIFV